MSTLENAIEAIKVGQTETGRQILEQLLDEDENNESYWLWMSIAVDNEEECEICLDNVLALNPNNALAQQSLNELKSGSFDPNDLLGALLPQEAGFQNGNDDALDLDFKDDFFESDSDSGNSSLDDDLQWPSFMNEGASDKPKGKSQPKASTKTSGKKKKTAKKSSINIRLVILALLGLFVCVGLAAAAAYNLLLSGGDGLPLPEQQLQSPQEAEVPAEAVPEEVPPTETATPAPTPTPENTPFELPTPKPTAEPSATATPVVSPTPPGGG